MSWAYLWIGLGGGLGAMARFWFGGAVLRIMGSGGFPWGTLAVNLLGCFVMGLVAALLAAWPRLPQELRLFLTTGILGGFTTFSAFALEAVGLMDRGAWFQAAAYVLGSVALSIVGLGLGRSLMKLIV